MTRKRLLSLILTFTLVIGLFAAGGFSAVAVEAAEVTANVTMITKVLSGGQNVIAVAIDLGEGNSVNAADLSMADFTVKGIHTMNGAVKFNGTRAVRNIYVNNEPNVTAEAPSSGRHIILEIANGATFGGGTLTRNTPHDLSYTVTVASDIKSGDKTLLSKDSVYTMKDGNAGRRDLILEDFAVLDGEAASADAERLHYSMYKPEGAEGETYPLVLWLHGGGEGAYPADASNPNSELVHTTGYLFSNMGGTAWVEAQLGGTIPKTYVVAPQADAKITAADAAWTSDDTKWDWTETQRGTPRDSKRINALLKEILAANPDIDTSRIYVTGCSMGGGQTYAQLIYSAKNEGAVQFAAAMPVCPAWSVDPIPNRYNGAKIPAEDVPLIAKTPLWIFHSADDGVIPVANTRATVAVLSDLTPAPMEMRVTYYPAELRINHGAWVPVLNNTEDVSQTTLSTPFAWLFDHKAADIEDAASKVTMITKVLSGGQNVIAAAIDLGEGNSVNTADLNMADFTVKGIHTLSGVSKFNGSRAVRNIYVNNEPNVILEAPSSGRYIILETANGAAFGSGTIGKNTQHDISYTVTVSADVKSGDETLLSKDTEYTMKAGKAGRRDLILEDFAVLDGVAASPAAKGLHYSMYKPEAAEDETYPLVIWLHGNGEGAYPADASNPDSEVVSTITPIVANMGGTAWVEAQKNGTIPKTYVVTPQADKKNSSPDAVWDSFDCAWDWLTGKFDDSARIDALVKELIAANPDIDTARIYVAGCSMGGGQTNAQLIYSQKAIGAVKFAAAMPVCPAYSVNSMSVLGAYAGAIIPQEDLPLLAKTPMWVFQAEDDRVVSPANTKATVSALSNLIPAPVEVRTTYYPAELRVNHGAWVPVLNNTEDVSQPDLSTPFAWLFDHTASDIGVGVGVTQLVAGLAANVPVTVEGNDLGTVNVKIVSKDGQTVYGETDITGAGKGTVSIPASKNITAGIYDVVATSGTSSGSATLKVVPYNTDIWAVQTDKSVESKTRFLFAADISTKNGYKVTVGAKSFVPVQDGNALVIDYVAGSGDVFVISGVKYAKLFPSYSFSFTIKA